MEDLKGIISKKTVLQIGVKAVNNTTSFNGLVPILLIFRAYSRMHNMNSLITSILQRATTIDKAMNEIQKIRAENQIPDVFKTRNRLLVDLVHNLLLNFDILV